MKDLTLSNLIQEKRDAQNLSYILMDDQLFFSTGYKVLQNQEKNGFIKCTKVLHNGKIKLVYDVSAYKTLQSLLPMVNADTFLIILSNLINVVDNVKNNGFMQCDNIDISFDKIFIDCNNYSVFLIYLPINNSDTINSTINFENKLKGNIRDAISKYDNINSSVASKMYDDIIEGLVTLDVIKENLKSRKISDTVNELKMSKASEVASSSYVRNEESTVNTKQAGVNKPLAPSEKAGFLSRIFGKKSKKEVSELNVSFEPISEGGATEILDDIFTPTLIFSGIKTSAKVEIIINKPEFTIGKNPEAVDGVINFNKAISRIHCKILYIENRYYIVDLGSANFTYVNGVRAAANQQVPVKAGDIIRLANSDFALKAL